MSPVLNLALVTEGGAWIDDTSYIWNFIGTIQQNSLPIATQSWTNTLQTIPHSYPIYGSTGTSGWYCLGTVVSTGDAHNMIFTIYDGNGYNGGASQNCWTMIMIKDGY
jgi:hypothetical protein